jgi:hypothetical protein
MKKLLLLSLTLFSSITMASELNVPNQFEDGQVTSAAKMNTNFDAIQAAVNDNHARIESMQQSTKAVFQGFSTDSMNGGQGLIAMQQACHNFVPGSHICNTTEFAQSPYNADAAATMEGSNAYILPDIHTMSGTKQADKFTLTQTQDGTNLTCGGWYAYSGSSVIVASNGSIRSAQSCSLSRKIACCK